MLLRLAIVSKSPSLDSIHDPPQIGRADLASVLGWGDIHCQSPAWVLVDGSYGAGYGPLVSRHLEFPVHTFLVGSSL